MRIGIFIPKSNQMLQDLVVDLLAGEPDFDVSTLVPDPARQGRAPLGVRTCDVVVFTSNPDFTRTVEDLGVCVGQSCVELLDDGRRAASWRITAASRPERIDSFDSLPQAIRRVAQQRWHA